MAVVPANPLFSVSALGVAGFAGMRSRGRSANGERETLLGEEIVCLR